MLWFKSILGLIFYEVVSILFAIVPDYGNEYTTKENKNWTSFKDFALKLNLNHDVYLWFLPIWTHCHISSAWAKKTICLISKHMIRESGLKK